MKDTISGGGNAGPLEKTTALQEIIKMQFANQDELWGLYRRLEEMVGRFIGTCTDGISTTAEGKVSPAGVVGILKEVGFSTADIISRMKQLMDTLEEQG
jgi:hypothetical protein